MRHAVRIFVFVVAAVVLVRTDVRAMEVGANLSVIADYQQGCPFIDLMKMARSWTFFHYADSGGCHSLAGDWIDSYPFGCDPVPDGLVMPTDENGYPLEVPFEYQGQQYRPVTVILASILPQAYPAGDYALLFEGTGEINLGWADTAIVVGTGGITRYDFELKNQGKPAHPLMLTIRHSDPSDHVRNIHLVPVDRLDDFQEKVFADNFLEDLRPFTAIRFMDWCQANWSNEVTWSDRRLPSHYTQAGGFSTPSSSAAYEYMILLCNMLQKDCWINVPVDANDDYHTQLATMIRDRLDPDLTLYLEWGNETWNGMFYSAHYGWQAHGTHAARLFRNFDQVFGSEAGTRIVHVLSGQHVSSGVLSTAISSYKAAGGNSSPVAIATAPYDGDGGGGLGSHKAMADANGYDYILYEGGAHGSSYDGWMSYLNLLDDYVSLFMQYTAVDPEWGAKVYTGQSITDTRAYGMHAIWDYNLAQGLFNESDPVVKDVGAVPWWEAELDLGGSSVNRVAASYTPVGPGTAVAIVDGALAVSGRPGAWEAIVTDLKGRTIARLRGQGVSRVALPGAQQAGTMLVQLRTRAGATTTRTVAW